MSWFTDFYRTAVGKKAVMALTGIILFGFVLLHMIGNLKLYQGPDKMNAYGEFLRHVGEPAIPAYGLLWLLRIVLLVSVVLHIWAAWQLTRMNQVARPTRYRSRQVVHTTYASRTMRWGGVIVLLFVVYHLLHFTTGHALQGFQPGKPYENAVVGFSVWWVSLFYVVAQVALGFHLYHGLWSMFQSLGWNHPRFNHWRSAFAHAFAWIITIGNVSFPVAVLAGIVS